MGASCFRCDQAAVKLQKRDLNIHHVQVLVQEMHTDIGSMREAVDDEFINHVNLQINGRSRQAFQEHVPGSGTFCL